ncbi:MAG: hypothetical protein OEY89_12050, partial [Gammaproteobacteria bacterium]|nr:hypothetical protein [Gammaproteobacteria bacterium]
MKSITFDKFDVGLDLRKGASVSDANRLRQLKNGYVTTGKVIRKRPARKLVATLEAGTKGLISGQGKLNTFYESGTITHANTLFQANLVAHPTTSQLVSKVHRGDVFSGYLYVSVEYADGSIWHHYLNGGSPTHVTDVNCPQSAEFIKVTDKIWSPDGEVVRFSATNSPKDWTSVSDAGYLPTGLQQRGALDALALGQFRKDLVVYFVDGIQIWNPGSNPANHSLSKIIQSMGCGYPGSIGYVGDDSFFLSSAGYRSISGVGTNDTPVDIDVGSPIDSLVVPLLGTNIKPIAGFYRGGGQYWCAIGRTIHVYTYSRTMKISAWAEYDIGVSIDDIAELNGELYVRSGDNVYRIDKNLFTDDGTSYELVMDMAFLDFKRPGVLKQIIGVDAVIQGEADLQLRWDPRDSSLITDKIPLSGDTRPGEMTPVEVIATSIAPVITSSYDGL